MSEGNNEETQLIDAPFHFEIHVSDKQIAAAKDPVIAGVKIIEGNDKGDVGFEVNQRDSAMIDVSFAFIAINLKKKDLDEAIRRYQDNSS